MDNVEYANINPITFCVFNTCDDIIKEMNFKIYTI